jgi:F0F1-type ATP synthase assembly protein I
MPKIDDPDPGNFVGRSAKSLQENVTRSGGAAAASYGLIGAVIVLGGIGFALDRWRGTTPWFLLGGLLLGLVVGFYDLARTIWKK